MTDNIMKHPEIKQQSRVSYILFFAVFCLWNGSGCSDASRSEQESHVLVSDAPSLHMDADANAMSDQLSQLEQIDETVKPSQLLDGQNHPWLAKTWEPISSAEYVTAEDAEHWAFQRLAPVSVPVLSSKQKARFAKQAEPSRNAIDFFLRTKLAKSKLTPNSKADAKTLLRRVYFDVVGLQPELQERKEFLQHDDAEQAYEELVEELLDSPHYGERWGRHWLDLARYADSNGYEYDEDRPNAYPYRDFIIYSLNEDLPYDQFIQLQIAGDELRPDHPLAVAATGFFTAAPHNTFFPQEIERYDEIDDMIATMGEAMLGLTVGCARCHEHKYDPIPTTDYHALVSVFSGSQRGQAYLVPDQGKAYMKQVAPYLKVQEKLNEILERAAVDAKIDELDITDEEKELLKKPFDSENKRQVELFRNAGTRLRVYPEDLETIDPRDEDEEECNQLRKQLEEMEASLPEEPQQGLTLSGSDFVTSPYLKSGSLNAKGVEIPPGFLSVLTKQHPNWRGNEWTKWRPELPGVPKSSQSESEEKARPRSALASWMTDLDEGAGHLLARVVVNRIWQHYFGEGLVRTTSDFGLQGESPDHPELLDWLANELVRNDWKLKSIHRLILNSAAYRQSSKINKKHIQHDPENRLLARQTRKRMEAEILRDSILQLGGNLNREFYGSSIKPIIPREAIFNVDEDASSTWPIDQEDGAELWRRSVYVFLKRSNPVPFLQLFDAPDAGVSCARRNVTTSPSQALALWNEPMMRSQSTRIAMRVRKAIVSDESLPPNYDDLTNQAYRLILGRAPSDWEQKQAVEFLDSIESSKESFKTPPEKLAQLCHVLLLTNEFLYVD